MREARAELEAAKEMPYIAPSLVLEAVRKARNAVHYSLGEPAFIEKIIEETDGKRNRIGDPVLRCLVRVDEKVQQMMKLEKTEELAMKQADNLIHLASEIVETLTGEEIKD
jgi:hypothetical protein